MYPFGDYRRDCGKASKIMTNEEFGTLVSRLEQQSRESPRWYRLRVTLLAFLGYGYVAVMLALLTALSLAAFASAVYLKAAAVKIAIPIVIVVGLILKAMWVRPLESLR